jgi:hypothetical protein
MSNQPVARPLPKHRTTQTQNKRIHTHTPNIRALIGFRTHDPSVRASEDSSCRRLRGYSDRLGRIYRGFLSTEPHQGLRALVLDRGLRSVK